MRTGLLKCAAPALKRNYQRKPVQHEVRIYGRYHIVKHYRDATPHPAIDKPRGLGLENVEQAKQREACGALVHEAELAVRDIVRDLPPVFDAFYADEQARTCPTCATVHPGKG